MGAGQTLAGAVSAALVDGPQTPDLLRRGAGATTAEFTQRVVGGFQHTYANAEFPAQLVYGPSGGVALQLVTCGGTYDHRANSYTANVKVATNAPNQRNCRLRNGPTIIRHIPALGFGGVFTSGTY